MEDATFEKDVLGTILIALTLTATTITTDQSLCLLSHSSEFAKNDERVLSIKPRRFLDKVFELERLTFSN